MRFDNAFLTAAKKVGMQFVDQRKTFTVYRDKKDVIHVSEEATKEQKEKMVVIYNKLEGKYKPKHVCSHHIHMGKYACDNKEQCFEPCGDLGHSFEHAVVVIDSGSDDVPHCGLDCFVSMWL